MTGTNQLAVDPETLRALVRDTYRMVAAEPSGAFHFHTGRALTARLGYDPAIVDALPDAAVATARLPGRRPRVPRPQARVSRSTASRASAWFPNPRRRA